MVRVRLSAMPGKVMVREKICRQSPPGAGAVAAAPNFQDSSS